MPQRILARSYRYHRRLLYGAAVTLSIAILGVAVLASITVVDQYRDKQVALFVTKREQVKSEVDNLSVRLMQFVDLYEAAWSLHQKDDVPLQTYQLRLREGNDVTGTNPDLTVTPFTLVSSLSNSSDAERLAGLLRILRDVSAAPSIDARKIGVTLHGGIYSPDGKFMAFSPPLDEAAQRVARQEGAVRFNVSKTAFAENLLSGQSPRELRANRPFWVTDRRLPEAGVDILNRGEAKKTAISEIVLPIFHGEQRVLTIDVSVGFDDFLQFFLHSERTPGFFVLDSASQQNLGFSPSSAADKRRYRAIQRQSSVIGHSDGTLRSYRDGGVFYISQKINGTGWVAVYVFDWRDVVASLHREAILGLCIVLASLLFLWGSVIFFDKRIAGPLSVSIQKRIEAEHFSKSVIDTIPVGVAVYVPETNEVVLENAVATQMLADDNGKRSIDFYTRIARDWPSSHEAGDHLFREVAWPVGANRTNHIGVAASRTPYGGRVAVLFGLVDLNFKKENERLLIQAKEKADEANKAKSMFLALMTHEIRTPLHGASGHLELLEREVIETEHRERVALIRRAFGSLLQIVDDLLDLTKVESNALTINSVRMCVNDVVEQAVQQFAPAITRRGVRCLCFTDPRLDDNVHGDPQRTGQILLNLLSNATKFTESGVIVVRSHLIISDARSLVRLEVTDTGIGIPSTVQSTLFSPMSQADNTISRRFGGTGLGLFLCRKLAKLMGGDITLTSAPGTGSTFRVDLPFGAIGDPRMNDADDYDGTAPRLRDLHIGTDIRDPEWQAAFARRVSRWGGRFVTLPDADAQEDASLDILVTSSDIDRTDGRNGPELLAAHTLSGRVAPKLGTICLASDHPLVPRHADGIWYLTSLSRQALRSALRQLSGRTPVPESQPMYPPQRTAADLDILIAEDEDVSRRLLTDQLRRLGCHRIRSAANGLAALALWHEQPADLVITDLSMPELDGPDLLREIRRVDPQATIICTTASVRDAPSFSETAFDGQLDKPVSLDDLARILDRFAGKSVNPINSDIDSTTTSYTPLDDILWRAFQNEWTKDRASLDAAITAYDKPLTKRLVHRLRGALLALGDETLIASLESVADAVQAPQDGPLQQAWCYLIVQIESKLKSVAQRTL